MHAIFISLFRPSPITNRGIIYEQILATPKLQKLYVDQEPLIVLRLKMFYLNISNRGIIYDLEIWNYTIYDNQMHSEYQTAQFQIKQSQGIAMLEWKYHWQGAPSA